MKGYNLWSYAPYKPLLRNVGDIYICRVVPDETSVHFEWLDSGEAEYSVFYRKRNVGEFLLGGVTKKPEFTLSPLDAHTDYEFYVKAGDKTSRVRLARTHKSVGTVVNYLHPDDTVYSFSGRYLATPSLVRHPDGFLLASMDVFAGGQPQNLTLIFRSDDNGETWHYVSELMPCFWGKLFIHGGDVYMLSCSTEYGDLLIGRSTDGGKTFSAPVCLLRGSNGKGGNDGVHKTPMNMVIYNERLYTSLEWGTWDNPEFCHAAMVMSCHIHDDLLVPENWRFSQPLPYDPAWPGTVDGEAKGTIEGTLCVAPDGKLYNVMRYNITKAIPSYGLVMAYRVNTEDLDAPLEYSHTIKMPCNNSKFIIKYDEISKRYYSIVTRIDCEARIHRRNLLSLMRSTDMEHWDLVCDLIDKREEDMDKVGFQYVDFKIEGDDLIYLCRSSFNNADTYHNSNYSTFHRVTNFRDL